MFNATQRRIRAIPAPVLFLVLFCAAASADGRGDPGPRARDLGIAPGILDPGPLNAITDVDGVRVGHTTLIEGDGVRTGVTAVLPHEGNLFRDKVPAAVYVGNGFGKAAGFLQVRELGTIETPIVLTNTLSVPAGIEGAVRWTLDQPGNEAVRSVNAVVGECNDGRLNDIRAMAVSPEHVIEAIESAQAGPIAEGNVGGGTGMRAFGFKSGIGTSSRALPDALGGWTVGVLVQANYGGVLTVDGRRVGERLGQHAFDDVLGHARDGDERRHERGEADGDESSDEAGSCMIIIATDAPVAPRNLERMARRAILALGRTGSFMSNGSGDFVIAFSTARHGGDGERSQATPAERIGNAQMNPLFLATVEAAEESVYNALVAAETMTGRDGHTIEAIDLGVLTEIMGGGGEQSGPRE